MTDTMRAVVLDHAPAAADDLTIRDLPIPVPVPGEVLIRVEAFGLNRSELHTRLGLAIGVTLPRVLGIEATGTVVSAPGGEFAPGTQVVAMMGGMGRTFDGGYAEYTLVPARQVIPFRSDLDWSVLGAVPEMLQLTTYGGDATDLPASVLQEFLDAVAAGQARMPIHRVYALDEIAQAHRDMEDGVATGKLVVRTR